VESWELDAFNITLHNIFIDDNGEIVFEFENNGYLEYRIDNEILVYIQLKPRQ
jgi:hypothetical protein